MKRAVSLLVSLALLLGLLPGCGQTGDTPASPEPEPAELAEPSELPAAQALAEAVLPASGKEEGLEVEGLNRDADAERLAAYIEAICGLAADQWEDAAVIRGTGASAFEIVVLRLGDEDAAAGLETVLAEYLTDREGAFTGYAPAEAEMAANGLVRREERTVGLFICPDPERAGQAFAAAYHGEALPLPAEPVQAASFQASQEMKPLLDAFTEVCGGEIAEIQEAGGMVAAAAPNVTDGFSEMAETAYGIAPGQWADGFVLQSLSPDVSLFELAAFRMTDQDTAKQGMDALWTYKENTQARFCTIDSDGVKIVAEEQADSYLYMSGAHVVQNGEYIGLMICQNAEGAQEAFNRALHSVQSAEPSENPDRQSPEDLPVTEIMEGVFVTEVTWKDADGAPDPDHPGRIRYVPADDPRMELYDTSAIVSAWAKGDPSGLSGYDSAIYDNAKAVLENILEDGMSDLEKEAEIYDWVLRNVAYDDSHMDALEETVPKSYTPYGGLVDRAGVCLGYASTFQVLTELAGVECITVLGTGHSTEPHAWNMVRLNGEWYGVDATWDWSFYSSGMMNGREWRFFNVTSDYLARTNHQWDYDTVPEASAEDHGAPSLG